MPDCRSSFSVFHVNHDKVFIVDQDVGMSVTNDAENVVAFVYDRHPGRRIIYRDTNGDWDELLHQDGKFCGFKAYGEALPNARIAS